MENRTRRVPQPSYVRAVACDKTGTITARAILVVAVRWAPCPQPDRADCSACDEVVALVDGLNPQFRSGQSVHATNLSSDRLRLTTKPLGSTPSTTPTTSSTSRTSTDSCPSGASRGHRPTLPRSGSNAA